MASPGPGRDERCPCCCSMELVNKYIAYWERTLEAESMPWIMRWKIIESMFHDAPTL